jgi:hypothetical protein
LLAGRAATSARRQSRLTLVEVAAEVSSGFSFKIIMLLGVASKG